MAEETTVDATETFSVSFSFHDNHCGGQVEIVLTDLDEDLDLGDIDRDDPEAVYQALHDTAVDTEEDGDDNLAAELYDAAERLRHCASHCCDCSSYMWENEEEYINELLAELPEVVWATLDSNGEGSGFVDVTLTVSELYATTGIDYGFEATTVTWNNERLEVSFSGYPWDRPQ